MKNHFLILKVTLSVSLIVLSIAVPVNYALAGGAGWGNSPAADGVPLPPPIPPKGSVVQTADGVPLPPPIPPRPNGNSVQVADGVPLPPPVKPPSGSVVVQAGAGFQYLI